MGKKIITIRLSNGVVNNIPIGFILNDPSHKWITDFLQNFFNSIPKSVTDLFGEYPSEFDKKFWVLLKSIQGKSKRHEYANLLAPIWNYYDCKGLINEAQNFWIRIHKSVMGFEKENKIHIHKGALFYYWAWTILKLGDVDNGFLLIHQSFCEDQITHRRKFPKTPAYKTATLDYEDTRQFLYYYILELKSFLDKKINKYNDVHNRNLLIKDFHSRYLGKPFEIDSIFSFTHTLSRLYTISHYPSYILQNNFSAILMSNIFFDLLLIIDLSIRNKMGQLPKKKKYWEFSDEAGFLLYKSKINEDKNKNQIHLGYINDKSYCVNKLIDDALNNNFHFIDGYNPSKMEGLIFLAYKLRNFGAHNIKTIPNLWKRQPEILQGLFDILFFIVEELY